MCAPFGMVDSMEDAGLRKYNIMIDDEEILKI
jgi:hypothetical protein